MNPILKKLLNVGTAGVGIGAGAMYFGNEEEGETFTSYPKESRGKRLLRGEQVAFSEKLNERLGLSNELNKNQDLMNNQFEQFDTSDAMAMSKQNVSKWVKAGVDEDSAQWLGMIDTVYEKETELLKDENLDNQFKTMLNAMNVNYLDMNLDHHNQKRRKAGFDRLERQIQAPDQEHPEGTVRY